MALIEYAVIDGAVAQLTLNRPDSANAQNAALLDELDAAWSTAADDPMVKVILLTANGKHFSAGHDMVDVPPVTYGGEGRGIAEAYEWERRVFFGYSRRWRDIVKPSIAAVQGACVGAGLMLCWPCDIIIASDSAYFSDPVLRMGIPGVEYHAHTWEWGPRVAKEMLFTGRKMSAVEAHDLGMVSRVVPTAELYAEARALAGEIAEMNGYGLAQVKRAVNLTMDIMGQHAALESVFDIHWTGHSNALSATSNRSPAFAELDDMRRANASKRGDT